MSNGIRIDAKQLSMHLGYYLDEEGAARVLRDLAQRLTTIASSGGKYGADAAKVKEAAALAPKLRAIAGSLRP